MKAFFITFLTVPSICSFFPPVIGWCEGGYSTDIDGMFTSFTDLLEADFSRIDDISPDTDWQRQAFNLTKDRARGDYGEMFAVENIHILPEAGLNLTVSSHLVDGMVPVAEVDSSRADLYRGSFRASLKLSDIPGTCAAFFWYYNDTQEIDMEFLTKDFNPSNNSFPVNLILQSTASKAAGYNAAHSGNMITSYLPFNPTVDFHEYRIDYLSDRVFFYADGQQLALLDTSAVPTKAGRLILQHWSNGNPLWSSGPPQTDSVLMVRYVKAYFNSTHGRRGGNGEGTVCQIPEMTPGNKTAAGWFFSGHANMTNNQTVWGKSGGHRLDWSWSLSLMICLGMSGWLSGLW